MMQTVRAQQNQTAPDQSNDAPCPALLFGKPIESAFEGNVYTHPRTGLMTTIMASGRFCPSAAVRGECPLVKRVR